MLHYGTLLAGICLLLDTEQVAFSGFNRAYLPAVPGKDIDEIGEDEPKQ